MKPRPKIRPRDNAYHQLDTWLLAAIAEQPGIRAPQLVRGADAAGLLAEHEDHPLVGKRPKWRIVDGRLHQLADNGQIVYARDRDGPGGRGWRMIDAPAPPLWKLRGKGRS